MDAKLHTTTTSALQGRPEQPAQYACPVTASDGSVGYDRPLDNYFDTSMTPPASQASSTLYDAIARAHDHRFQVSPDMLDPCMSRPLLLCHERRRSLAKIRGNSADYMGISPDYPEWRPRRSSYEDRRGAVGVLSTDVNALVPHVLPVDTSVPRPSQVWFGATTHEKNIDTPQDTDPKPSPAEDDDFTFDYDTDSDLEPRVTIQRPPSPQRPKSPAPTEESESDTDTESGSETDEMNSDDAREWEAYVATLDPKKVHWLIPRRRRSVDTSLPTSQHTGKRRHGGSKTAPYPQVSKAAKKHANDSPGRHAGESIDVHAASESEPESSSRRPIRASSRIRATASQSSDPPKTYACLLDGCTRFFSSMTGLHRHQHSHRHREPSYPCLGCRKSYTRVDALKRHLDTKASCKVGHAANASREAI